jgi:hypothetical protein
MPTRPQERDPQATRRGPPLTPIQPSNAWVTAKALHGKALMPPNTSPEAFDEKAAAFWKGGQVEQTFTSANLAYLRLAQAEDHHLALINLFAAQRSDIAALAQQVHVLHGTLQAVGKLIKRGTADQLGIGEEALQLLTELAEAWTGPARPAAAEPGDEGGDFGGEELVDLEADPRPRGRAQRPAPLAAVRDDDGEADGDGEEELVEVDEQGRPVSP